VIPLLLVAMLAAATTAYDSAQRKFNSIESDRLRPGSRVTLTYPELVAFAMHSVPDGVRDPNLERTAPQTVTGRAMVDFGKLRSAEGHPPGWLMAKLLEGERPVSVTARIASSRGHVQVDVQRVAISGMEIDGRTLDFLIQHIVLPLYPDAVVGRPFALSHHIDRLDIGPGGVGVTIAR
jgi:hypothetical protein